MLKRIILFILFALVLFIGYLLLNLLRFESRQIQIDNQSSIEISPHALTHFSEALKIQTISTEDPANFDSVQFESFNRFLETTYPLVDSLLEKQLFLRYSHLYKWQGKSDARPILLMGHLDVVPIVGENTKDWKYGGFEGKVAEDTIWGRGTLDDKVVVVALMEVVESLLSSGYQPERTVYLSFGHDEEVGGFGAQAIAKHFEQENIQLDFVLDEGSVITSGLVPGIEKDVALIGIAEKGFVTIHLSVEIEGGHSSMPQKETAIDVLSKAVYKVKSNPFPATLTEPVMQFFSYAGPEMKFPNNLVFANAPIFSSIIKGIYAGSNAGNANIRTTTSPTIFTSGVKENVIPKRARATINFRILPGETVDSVLERVTDLIDDDRVKLTKGQFVSNPSSISSVDSDAFLTIQKTIHQVYPGSIVSPSLVVPATDSRHFEKVARDTYRFSPIRLNHTNLNSIHGINERIAVKEYYQAIQFYSSLIQVME